MNGGQVSENLTIESSPVRGNHVAIPFKFSIKLNNHTVFEWVILYVDFMDVTMGDIPHVQGLGVGVQQLFCIEFLTTEQVKLVSFTGEGWSSHSILLAVPLSNDPNNTMKASSS